MSRLCLYRQAWVQYYPAINLSGEVASLNVQASRGGRLRTVWTTRDEDVPHLLLTWYNRMMLGWLRRFIISTSR